MNHLNEASASNIIDNPDKEGRAFLPAALEIIETPPSPTGRLLSIIICIFVLLVSVWASFGQVDIIAVASGKIIPSGRSQVIQASDNGIVVSAPATVGQTVRQGDVLAELDVSSIEAEANRAENDMVRALLDQTRLEAFLADAPGDPFAALVGLPYDKIVSARLEFETQKFELQSKLLGMAHEAEQRQAEIDTAREELSRATDIRPLIEQRADIRKKSYETTYGSLLLSLEADQQVIETKSAQRIALQKIAEGTAALKGLEEKRNEIISNARRSAFTDLTRALAQKDAAIETKKKAERHLAISKMTSPIDGIISQVSIHSKGAVVVTGQQLMTVVPENRSLEIEAVLANREAGFVKIGQSVEIKIDAYPFTRYGLIKGHVVNVSGDAEPQPNGPERPESGNTRNADMTANLESSERLVYLIKVAIEDQDNKRDGNSMKLVPGMSARVEIKTGVRSIASYIISPLTQYLNESIKER
jgi:HlyD family secretion protein/hemolysin D